MAVRPDFRAARFEAGASIDNPYFPLTPGTIQSYGGSKTDPETGETETERNDVFVTHETKTIKGIQTTVVRDTAYKNGVLVEDTLDWYAQDTNGNVWYFGEIAYNYEYDDAGNYVETNNDGSWLAGKDGAKPGWIMKAAPAVGDSYFQEFAPGIAEDEAKVVAVDQQISIDLGDYSGVLKTLDTTALDPGAREFKYYAPGVGQIFVEEGVTAEGPDFVVELQGVRQVGARDDDDDDDAGFALSDLADGQPLEGVDDAEGPDLDDVEGEGESLFVTFLGGNTDLNDALGAYAVNARTGRIGEGRILFDGLGETAAGETASVEVGRDKALGLFVVLDGAELGLDLSAFENGGLFFTNMLTGRQATLGDGLAPLVTSADKQALPIQALHVFGNDDGVNVLNPAAGLHAVELRSDLVQTQEDDIRLFGFEDGLVTGPGFDGDYDDVVVAVSEVPLSEDLIAGLTQELGAGHDSDVLIA
jgi:hypothetical protein